MTSLKFPHVRRTSLVPPHERSDLPNAPMVDRSSVPKTITQHPRQRDQETATVQEQQKQIEQQRLSLINAIETLDNWHKKSANEVIATGTYRSTNIREQMKREIK